MSVMEKVKQRLKMRNAGSLELRSKPIESFLPVVLL